MSVVVPFVGAGDWYFIAAYSAPFALRDGILYVRVLQPVLHYELEQVSKIDILRKLKQRFGAKTHPGHSLSRGVTWLSAEKSATADYGRSQN